MVGKISEDPLATTLTGAIFAAVQGGANVGVPAALFNAFFATRAAAAGVVLATGTLFWTLGYSAPADGGESTYIVVGSEPSHAGKISLAGGLWGELKEPVVNLEMFGGKADAIYTTSTLTSGTDNYAAFVAAEAYLAAKNPQAAVDVNLGGRIILNRGSYYVSQSLNFKHRMEVFGCNGGSGSIASKFQCVLVFPQNTTGIFINRANTLGDTKISPVTTSAGSTYLERFAIYSLGGTDRTKHGIRFRGLCETYHVNIYNFPGDGINAIATSGSSIDSREGNCNYSRISYARIEGCQNGVNAEGADANAIVGIGINTDECRAFGVRDNAFLGNDWGYCGAQANGHLSRCFYGGNRYWAGPALDGTDTYDPTLYNSTTPGTDENVWIFWEVGGAGGNLREWIAANVLEWTQGGPAGLLGDSSKSTINAGYLGEGNQPPLYINPLGANSSYGGLRTSGFLGGGLVISGAAITGAGPIEAETIATSGSGALIDALEINNVSSGNNRLQRVSFSNNYLSDGVTKKKMVIVDGGIDANGNPSIKVRGNLLADANTFADLLEITGGSVKRFMPGVDNVSSLGIVTKRWLEGFITKLFIGAGATFITSSSGSPEGVVTAPIGSLYTRTDGGAGTTLYIKESNTGGNTGWVAK